MAFERLEFASPVPPLPMTHRTVKAAAQNTYLPSCDQTNAADRPGVPDQRVFSRAVGNVPDPQSCDRRRRKRCVCRRRKRQAADGAGVALSKMRTILPVVTSQSRTTRSLPAAKSLPSLEKATACTSPLPDEDSKPP